MVHRVLTGFGRFAGDEVIRIFADREIAADEARRDDTRADMDIYVRGLPLGFGAAGYSAERYDR
jgi:hypothetical protein